MQNSYLEVRLSSIEGMSLEYPWGVFSKTWICSKVNLLVYTGRTLTKKQLKRQDPHGLNRYIFECDNGTFVDGSDTKLAGMAKFINSTDPGEAHLANVKVYTNTKGELQIMSTKVIPAGHELFYDYGTNYGWEGFEHKSVAPTKTISADTFLHRSRAKKR
jgi:hypothetical protein